MSAQTKRDIAEVARLAFEGVAWLAFTVTACVFVAVI